MKLKKIFFVLPIFIILFSCLNQGITEACSITYIDNDDPNWANGTEGTWNYINNKPYSYRGDYEIAYNGSSIWTEYFWGQTGDSYRVCGSEFDFEVYLNDLNFTDPAADYYRYAGAGFWDDLGTINQYTAAPGWNYLITLVKSEVYFPFGVVASGKGYTGADGIEFVPTN